MKSKEIFFCNLTLQDKNKKKVIKNVVYKETDGYYKNDKEGINNPLKVIHIDVIKSLGYESLKKTYTEIKKSDNKRNDITGAYD
jgi:hypothetical protein